MADFMRLISILVWLASGAAFAGEPVIPIWPEVPAHPLGRVSKEVEFYEKPLPAAPAMLMVRNVVNPTLTVYVPSASVRSGAAVIVCPGGGGVLLDWKNEGLNVGEWLAEHGVTAFILKYRLAWTPEDSKEFASFVEEHRKETFDEARALGAADARQALNIVTQRAAEWHVSPNLIGFMGISMGAFIALDATLARDRTPGPAFLAAIYGGDIGKRQVPAGAPPLFALAARDDLEMAPRVLSLYQAWTDAGRAAEIHMYMQGGHGFGTIKQGLPVDTWLTVFERWLVSVQGHPGSFAQKR